MKKIFFFDMDGTIVDRNSVILPETIEALHEARTKGHKLAIATGRPLLDIRKSAKDEDFDYLIGNNGANMFDVEKQEFVTFGEVPTKIALEIFDIARENKSMLAVHAKGSAYRIDFGEQKIDQENDPNFKSFEWFTEKEIKDIIKNNPLAQVSIRDQADKVNKLIKLFKNHKDVDAHIANAIYLDINPKGINKAEGVKQALKLANMSQESTVAFGDSGNDLQMLKWANLGYAMGNGTDDSKEAADEVIGDHNTTSIAKKIRELI